MHFIIVIIHVIYLKQINALNIHRVIFFVFLILFCIKNNVNIQIAIRI